MDQHMEKNVKTYEITILHLEKKIKSVCSYPVPLYHLQSWEIFSISPGSTLNLPSCG